MRKDGAQVLVLRDRSMGDALSVRIEDATGQCDAFGTHLEAPIRHLVHIYLPTRPRVTLHDKGARKGGIVTFALAGETPLQTKARLGGPRINVSVSSASSARIDLPHRGLDAVVRASVHAFNTESEIEHFVKALASLS